MSRLLKHTVLSTHKTNHLVEPKDKGPGSSCYFCKLVTTKSHDPWHYTGNRGVNGSNVHNPFQNSDNDKNNNTTANSYGVIGLCQAQC